MKIKYYNYFKDLLSNQILNLSFLNYLQYSTDILT